MEHRYRIEGGSETEEERLERDRNSNSDREGETDRGIRGEKELLDTHFCSALLFTCLPLK